jgi:hypothetical protein
MAPAIPGYLIAAIVAIGVALLIAGPRHVVRRDPTFELEDVGQIETSTEAIGLGFLPGAVIGAAQAAVLMRAGVANAWAWVPVTAVAWGVGWLVTSGIGVALASGWPVFDASGAVVSQIITAIALWRLVRSRDALTAAA